MPVSDGKNYTILIVDDDPDLVQLLTDGLELLGHYKVVQAEDGKQGLKRYFEIHPDCVIIDVVMPEIDGYQLAQLLRGDPASAATPLIILTALAQDKDRLSALAVGADQYLVKPVTPRALVEAVRCAVAISESERWQQQQRLAVDLDNLSGED
jgi:DNA-binding response OmpR family regulator